ncbi:hypothetical protein [Sphingomonas sp.]|jgi:signal transduction histidine kinase|uniref:hypothetical protein n=1 Tax=Sphingomonas sp. TaxID=28214 RepID=UPI003D6C9CD9
MSSFSDSIARIADTQSLAELARKHTRVALDAIAAIAASNTARDTTRMAAAALLLNRGWGRIGFDLDGDDEPNTDLAKQMEAAGRRLDAINAERRAVTIAARQGCGCTACLEDLLKGPL